MKKIEILNGESLEILKQYPDNYFDSVVTDPPYGLGKEPNAEQMLQAWITSGYLEVKGSGFMGKEWDAFVPQPIFWKEVFRVLKHGGHIVSFFGTRTYDWGVMSMRLAGFEIRDCIQWIYGSGFPKSHNISKAIDKMGGKSLDWFIDYILEIAKEKGITKKELTMLFPSKNGNATGWLWNKQNNQSITLEQYNKIKDYLQLPFENIEEAEREVICKGKAGLTKGNIANFSGETEFDITAPSTEEAKQWEGWGSALKPANEPIVLARKPLEKGLSIAENVMKWGTGGINIDGCRVKMSKNDYEEIDAKSSKNPTSNYNENPTKKYGDYAENIATKPNTQGRFPANIILTHHPECECVGTKEVKSNGNFPSQQNTSSMMMNSKGKSLNPENDYSDENGQETIESWNCHKDCPIKIMDEQSFAMGIHSAGVKRDKEVTSEYDNTSFHAPNTRQMNRFGDKGGASRFFYVAKASKKERNKGLEGFNAKQMAWSNQAKAELKRGNTEFADNTKMHNKVQERINFHPTVKPVALMQYLVRMITPPNGIVLDPFNGSGTTGVACKVEGFNYVGIELDAEYCKISEARIEGWKEEIQIPETIEQKKSEKENIDGSNQLTMF
jgi:site-specific DNA-methyltransferase (adenine-specific)